jgi:hypothetical protein
MSQTSEKQHGSFFEQPVNLGVFLLILGLVFLVPATRIRTLQDHDAEQDAEIQNLRTECSRAQEGTPSKPHGPGTEKRENSPLLQIRAKVTQDR